MRIRALAINEEVLMKETMRKLCSPHLLRGVLSLEWWRIRIQKNPIGPDIDLFIGRWYVLVISFYLFDRGQFYDLVNCRHHYHYVVFITWFSVRNSRLLGNDRGPLPELETELNDCKSLITKKKATQWHLFVKHIVAIYTSVVIFRSFSFMTWHCRSHRHSSKCSFCNSRRTALFVQGLEYWNILCCFANNLTGAQLAYWIFLEQLQYAFSRIQIISKQ